MILDKVAEEKQFLSIGSYLVKIERSHKKNLELKKRLNSYNLEPNTRELFLELENIKFKIELLHISYLNIKTVLKQPISVNETHVKKINKQLEESKLLDNCVNNYIKKLKATI